MKAIDISEADETPDPLLAQDPDPVAITYALVPSFRKFSNLSEIHPYPWLRLPHAGSVKSFSAWRGKLK